MGTYTKRTDKRGYEWKRAYEEKRGLMEERGYIEVTPYEFYRALFPEEVCNRPRRTEKGI